MEKTTDLEKICNRILLVCGGIVTIGLMIGTIVNVVNRDKNNAYLDSLSESNNCTVRESQITTENCDCQKDCHCDYCNLGDDECSDMLKNKVEGTCCDGYECCQRTCQRCCDKKNICHQCNCRCIDSVSDRGCKITCSTCYIVKFIVDIEEVIIPGRVIIDDCKKDKKCAQELLYLYQINSTYTCYFDPENYENGFVKTYFEREYETGNIALYVFFGIFGFCTCFGIILLQVLKKN